LLDIDFGTYPFVTSSNTMAAGVCTGLGIAPSKVGKVFGIFKAYCTRVGSGPFPTELFDDMGEYLRQAGHEFGATTGRPRRCGWLDMVALKYAVMMNGVTDLIMMKSDILNDLDTIKVAVGYKKDGEVIDWFPYDGAENIEPVYKEFKGWKSDICGIRDYESLPQEFKDYVAFIEKETGVNVRIISVGPDREATIVR
jgi:adenylosuccinate synthase